MRYDHLIPIRDRFRAEYPIGIASVGFRCEDHTPVLHVLYHEDIELPDEFEGLKVVARKSGPGVLCRG